MDRTLGGYEVRRRITSSMALGVDKTVKKILETEM